MAEITKEIYTPLYQRVGAALYKINLETTASQIVMSDGSDLETTINTIQNILSENTTTYVVANIEARDALENVIVGDSAWVIDASADETVESGAAKYIYQSETDGWVKVSEAESMDVIVQWSDIQNVPEVLEKLGLDEDGNLTVDGETVKAGTWVARVTSLDDLPSDLMEGGLVVVDTDAGTEPDDGDDGGDGDGNDGGDTGDTGDDELSPTSLKYEMDEEDEPVAATTVKQTKKTSKKSKKSKK